MGKTNSKGFQYVKEKCPKIKAAKLKKVYSSDLKLENLRKTMILCVVSLQLSKKYGSMAGFYMDL